MGGGVVVHQNDKLEAAEKLLQPRLYQAVECPWPALISHAAAGIPSAINRGSEERHRPVPTVRPRRRSSSSPGNTGRALLVDERITGLQYGAS